MKRQMQNSLPSSNHILFDLRLEQSKILLNALAIVMPLLSLRGATHAYLLERAMADSKYLIPLLYFLIN